MIPVVTVCLHREATLHTEKSTKWKWISLRHQIKLNPGKNAKRYAGVKINTVTLVSLQIVPKSD